jgi:hypothetical protein
VTRGRASPASAGGSGTSAGACRAGVALPSAWARALRLSGDGRCLGGIRSCGLRNRWRPRAQTGGECQRRRSVADGAGTGGGWCSGRRGWSGSARIGGGGRAAGETEEEIQGQFGRAPTDPDSLWELIL